MLSAATLRKEIEHALERRFPAALSPSPRTRPEMAPTGIAEVDELLDGGLPIGAISEVTGPECSGRTSLALKFLGCRTQEGHVCAWVDVEDAFDPESGAANGVCLKQLLWVRCGEERRGQMKEGKPWRQLDQALRATDLLLQAGGFSAIVLDMGGTAVKYAQRIPLATWFRFRQAAQRAQCSLVVIGQRACAQSSADVVLECKRAHTNADCETVLSGFGYEVRRERARGLRDEEQEDGFPRRSESDSSRTEATVHSSALLSLPKPGPVSDAESIQTKVLPFALAQRSSACEVNAVRRKPPVSTWSARSAWDREKGA